MDAWIQSLISLYNYIVPIPIENASFFLFYGVYFFTENNYFSSSMCSVSKYMIFVNLDNKGFFNECGLGRTTSKDINPFK